MNDLLLILASVGLLLILKYGFIFNVPREFIKNKAAKINNTLGVYIEKLISCSQCLGFWCGFVIFLLTGILEQNYNLLIYYSILFGFVSSLCSYLIDLITTYIDERIYKLQKENESKDIEENNL